MTSDAGAHVSDPRSLLPGKFSGAHLSAATRRRFVLANVSIALDEIVYLALVPLLPVFTAEYDFSKAQAGALFAAYPLCGLVAALPGGLLSDRFGPRKMLVVANCGFALATLGFAFASSASMLSGARGLQGLSSGLTATAGMVMITETAEADRRGRVLGLAVAFQGLSTLFGPALGGLLVPWLGLEFSFSLISAAALAVGALLAFLTRDADSDRVGTHAAAAMRDLAAILRRAAGRSSAFLFVAMGFSTGSVQTLATLHLAELGVTTEGIGLLMIAAGITGFPTLILAGRMIDRIGIRSSIRIWLVVGVASCVLLALAPGLAVTVVCMVVFFVHMRVGGTVGYAQALVAGDGGGMSTGFGFMVTAWAVGAALGPTLMGGVADATSDSAAYLITAIVLTALVSPGAVARPKLRA